MPVCTQPYDVLRKLPIETEIPRAAVVSDLHIGLPYFRRSAFVQFVRSLSPETALILNGDVIDNPYQQLQREDQAVLNFLREQSFVRRVVWIYGNHDENYQLPDPGRIEFRRQLVLGTRLMIVHGDDFDTVMAKSRWFMRLFKFCHKVRLRAGAAPVHVAEVAKRWAPLLYRFLTEQVKKNAVECASQAGVEAITCGHTHYAEDAVSEGVRYINTGTWTEGSVHYLSVREAGLFLRSHHCALQPGQQTDDADLNQAGDALI